MRLIGEKTGTGEYNTCGRKNKKLLIALCILVMSLIHVVPVSAAVKISAQSMVLIKGQSRILKVTGTKNNVEWSSSKKSVATVNSKGKVTAKKKGTATITAKVAKKKYICKVKVETPKLSSEKLTIAKGKTATLKVSGNSQKVTWKSSNKKIATVTSKGLVKGVKAGSCTIAATVGGKKYNCKVTVTNTQKSNGGVRYKSSAAKDGVAVIVKNNYPYAVSVDMDCLFYDSSGIMLKKSSDYEYALEVGGECALFAYNFDEDWDTYKVNMKVERASSHIILNAKNIKVSSSYGDENVMVKVSNAGQRNEFTKIAILFYVNGRVYDYEEQYADVKNKGDVDYLEFHFPYDYNYDTVIPDTYEIYVNSSYRYDW